MDVSKKMGLELRLLHSLAHGTTWYGRWGYAVHRATFGVTRAQHCAALATAASLPVTAVLGCYKHVDEVRLGYRAGNSRMIWQAVYALCRVAFGVSGAQHCAGLITSAHPPCPAVPMMECARRIVRLILESI